MDKRKAQATSAVQAAGRGFLAYLIATTILCGALVMAIEILGSRVIGPLFGVSLFVWTSLITVTLLALAGGYAAGGFLSDRRGSPSCLYGIILLAGICTLLIPALKAPVLTATLSWGLRAGAFASSLFLFGPALFLLGCVSPYLVKIAAKELRNIGRTVGVFYALSTVGSFAGTVLTGFVLIAYASVPVIFTIIGALLIALASGYFLAFRKSGVAVAVLFLPLALVPRDAPLSKVLPNGTVVTRICARDTFYGNLKVIEYTYGGRSHRELMIDGLIQGGADSASRLSVYEYPYFLEFLPYGMHRSGKDCLVIGLGAGLVPAWYAERGIRTDVVDINPEVVDLARRYFGYAVADDVIVSDARYYLNKTQRRYDYVILDAFNGDTTPAHLLSREALTLVKRRMSDQGILTMNLIGSLGRDRFMTASIVKTLRTVFSHVFIDPLFDPNEGNGIGNMTILAYDAAYRPFDRQSVAHFPVHPFASDAVSRYLGKRYDLPADEPAIVLSDDYNPVDMYDLRVREWMRTTILANIDADLLL